MAWLRFIWSLSRANPVPPGQSNSLNAELGFPPDLLVSLDRSSGRGLREQLEGELRRAVRAGRLAIGTALPPSRVLARELGVARSVVVDAYGQLAAEGYLEARQGSGTRVRATHPKDSSGDGGAAAPARPRPAAARRPARPRELPARAVAAPLPRRDRRALDLLPAVSRPAGRADAAERPRGVPRPGARRRHDARARPGLRRVHAGPGARLPRAASPGRAAPGRRGSLLQLPPRADRERRARAGAGRRRRQRHRRPARSRPRTTSRACSWRRRTPIRPARCWRRSVASSSRSGRARRTRSSSRTTTTPSSATTARRSARCRGCARIASCTAGASARR